ncbi:3D domain-containing protein [Aneurinibacillus terranovensis]|uniref:3D domain-containing protein n=1 Tax=Aneurinibacillus terranovensis TaxID=278991 RepID=UPI0003FB6834|nr:3D domain-containing protein [Aneurinibacillus terranovensis]
MNMIAKNVKYSLPYLLISLVLTMLGMYMLLEKPTSGQTPTGEPSKSQAVNKAVIHSVKKAQPKPEAVKDQFPIAKQGEALAALAHYPQVNVVATGYYPGPESTGKDITHPAYGITYSGVKVRRDKDTISTIAADLSVFPLGTILYIPGYGYGIVADIGSAIKGNKIDLYFDKKNEVYQQWGKKRLNVYIIEKGKGKLSEEMIRTMTQLKKEPQKD